MSVESGDDALTLVTLGALAFVLADVSHEALGHGVAALVVGAKPVILTTCYFGHDGSTSKWIPASGGLGNIVIGLISLVLLRTINPQSSRFRYFLVLALAFNLLFATAYPAYSGIASFGDWAAVISGFTPRWLWPILLVVASVFFYYLSLEIIASAIRPFCGSRQHEDLVRLRRITVLPYLAALAISGLGGALNPLGRTMIFTAALPAAAAAFGLTQMDHFTRAISPDSPAYRAGPIARSYGWIVMTALVLVFFVAVLGPGIRFSP